MSLDGAATAASALAPLAPVEVASSSLNVEAEEKPAKGTDAAPSDGRAPSPHLLAPALSADSTSCSPEPAAPSDTSSEGHPMIKREHDDASYSESSSSEDSDEEEDEKNTGTAGPGASVKGYETIMWSAEVNAALKNGLAKFPYIGRTPKRFHAAGQDMCRAAILAEYVRRQTGQVRSRLQIGARLEVLKSIVDSDFKRLINGNKIEATVLTTRDWDAELGPDHFPATQGCSSALKAPKKRKKLTAPKPNLKRSSSLSALPPFPPQADSSSGHLSKRIKQDEAFYPRSSYPPYYPQYYPPPPFALSSMPAPSPTFPPSHIPPSFYPAPVSYPRSTSTDSLPLSATSSSPLKPSELSAFFSTAFPSRDFTSSAYSLFESGITSVEALVELLLLDDESLEDFLPLLSRRTKLSAIEGGWVKKAVKVLGREAWVVTA
ncbi:hypothetical protein JCM6882_006932 [Rhodosporidiobolus microsporus]